MYEVETRDEPEQPTAVVRGTVEPEGLRSWLSATFGTVANHLQRVGVPIVGAPFARFSPRRGGPSLEVEAGLPVTEVIDGKDQVQPASLPGGSVAATWHRGSPEEIGPAYEAIESWVARTGVEAVGEPWEIYHTDPQREPDVASWQTEVVQPFREA